ncbi:substrate-binding domain-containing protein [Spirillospora sp. NPDC047418]
MRRPRPRRPAARASARAPAGLLRIGFTETTGGQDLDRLVRDLERAHPGIEAHLREIPINAPLDALRRDRVDVLVDWLRFDAPDITSGPTLAEYRRVLIVAADHPLAGRPCVSFEEVADYEVNERNEGGNRRFFPDRTRSGRPLRLHPSTTCRPSNSGSSGVPRTRTPAFAPWPDSSPSSTEAPSTAAGPMSEHRWPGSRR